MTSNKTKGGARKQKIIDGLEKLSVPLPPLQQSNPCAVAKWSPGTRASHEQVFRNHRYCFNTSRVQKSKSAKENKLIFAFEAGQNEKQLHTRLGLKFNVEMKALSYERHLLGGKKHSCEPFIVCLVFYERFYCTSATGAVVSA